MAVGGTVSSERSSGRHLIEGLKNPTVVRDKTALDVFPIKPMGIREAIQKALGEDKSVPNPRNEEQDRDSRTSSASSYPCR